MITRGSRAAFVLLVSSAAACGSSSEGGDASPSTAGTGIGGSANGGAGMATAGHAGAPGGAGGNLGAHAGNAGNAGNAGTSGSTAHGGSHGGSTSTAGHGGSMSAGGSSAGSTSTGGMPGAGGGTSAGGASTGGASTGGASLGGAPAGTGGSAAGASAGDSGAGGAQAGAGGAAGMVLSGDIVWPAGYTVAAGETLTLAAGSTVHVGAGSAIQVLGTLVALGTSGAPVTFQSVDHAGAFGWAGLVVSAGGDLEMSSIVVHDATTALAALAGSAFAIKDVTIDTSGVLAALASNGTITGGALHANGDSANSDSIVITDASPTLVGLVIDNGNTNVDHIQVNGATSAALFQHLDVSGAHCGFHFNEGTMVTIESSRAHDLIYGLMVENSTATAVKTSDFVANSFHLGMCFSGTAIATGCWFDAAPFDDSCAGQVNDAPASGPVPGAGP